MDEYTNDEYEQTDKLPAAVKIMFYLAAVLLAGFVGFIMFSFEGASEQDQYKEWIESERQPGEGDIHDPLRFVWDDPVLTSPPMETLSAGEPVPKRKILGIAVGDEAHAYVLNREAKENISTISTVIGGRPIFLVQDYIENRTRVLTTDGDELIDIRRGGIEDSSLMPVLIYNNIRYRMTSEQLPLEDYPFEITSLDKWAEEHPNTGVFYIQSFDRKKPEVLH